MKTQKRYVVLLLLLIISPVSIKETGTVGIYQAFADNITRDNKEFARQIEEMKIRITVLKRELEARQNKQSIASASHLSHTPQKIYTIQTGSFLNIARAEKEFNSLMNELKKKYHSFLRIEKIKDFYTVRLGKFENYNSAADFIRSIATEIPEPIIMKSFISHERLRSCICY